MLSSFSACGASRQATHRNPAQLRPLPQSRTAREEMRQVKMIGMRMSLEAVADIVQRTAVHLRRRHHIGAKINQQIFVNECRRALPQTGSPEHARLNAVSTFAESLRECICGGGPEKCD